MNGSSSFSSGDLDNQVAVLQRQMFVLLLVSLVMSFTLAGYLYYQGRIANKDTAAIRPQAMQIISVYREAYANHAEVTNFLGQIFIYAQKNPDFAQQVMKKNGINVAPPPTPARR